MIAIDELLKEAKEQGASDLHIMAGAAPKARIHGELTDLSFPKLSESDIEGMANSMLPDYLEKVLEQKGEADFTYSVAGLSAGRVHMFKQRGGLALAIRLLKGEIPSAYELQIPNSIIELMEEKQGLVLITGPAGCGKTTTAASLIDAMNASRNARIVTLERPIEYLYEQKKALISQREIGRDSESYAQAACAALHEDADVLLIGQLQDPETVLAAVLAAENGCLVLSELHTVGAVNTLNYLIDMFPAQNQPRIRNRLASALEAIVSQQLIPTQDGTKRVAAFEVMHATAAIKSLIRDAKIPQIDSMIQGGKKLGMQSMDDAIFEIYLKRKIDAKSALVFAQDPYTMERRLF